MTTRILIAALASFALLGALVPSAAAKDNTIYQDDISGHATAEDLALNELSVKFGPDGDSAYSASNCQFAAFADFYALVHASAEALGIISDADEVVVTSKKKPRFKSFADDLAESWCKSNVGDVKIQLGTVSGWGAPSALGMGSGSGTGSNTVSQTQLSAVADGNNFVKNEDFVSFDGSNLAASVSNCQGLVAARVGISLKAMASAEAEIEDEDHVVIAGAPDAPEPQYGPPKKNPEHKAASWCEQPIYSITITSNLDRVPPES